MMVYISDNQNSPRELIELVNSKQTGYNINSNKSEAFFYSKEKRVGKEIRETTLFTILTSTIKYLV